MESKNTRVAHCMVCGNEWVPRDSTTKKPSRCSACRSRTVKWRDLLSADELKAHDQYDVPGAEMVTPAPEPVEEYEEEEEYEYEPLPAAETEDFIEEDPGPEPSLESIRRGFPSFPPQAYVILIAAIGAVGLICFLVRKSRNRRPALPAPAPEQAPPQYTERDLKILRQQQVDNIIRRRLAGGGQRT